MRRRKRRQRRRRKEEEENYDEYENYYIIVHAVYKVVGGVLNVPFGFKKIVKCSLFILLLIIWVIDSNRVLYIL